MKNKRNIVLGIIIIILCIVFIAYLKKNDFKKNFTIEQGFLDLSGYTFNKNDIVSLDGKWEFYPGLKTFIGKEKKESKKTYVTFPSLLKDCPVPISSIQQKRLQSGTFRVNVRMPSKTKPMALYVPIIYSSSKIIINNKTVYTAGKPGEEKKLSLPGFKPGVVYLPETGKHLEIVLHVSNHYYSKGGVINSIYLGTSEAVSAYQRSIVYEIYLFAGILFFIAIYHILLFLLRSKNYSTLFFGIICLSVSFRILSTESILLLYHVPNISWEILIKIQYISYYVAAVFLFLFFCSLFPEEFHHKTIGVASVIIAFFAAVTLFSRAIFFSRYVARPFEFLSLLIMLGICFSLIRSVIHKRKGSVIILTGVVILLATMINDILHIVQIIETGYFLKYGWLCFVFIQAFVLSVNFSQAFEEIEQLSREITEKNSSLLSLDKLKDEFLANTSHELRTPLNGIIGITDSLVQGATEELNQQTLYSLSLIKNSAQRLSALVNDILDFSKMKNSRLSISSVAVDISQLVNMIISMEVHRIRDKELKLKSIIPHSFPLVYADENRVVQILFNLIDNAIKFTESGEIEVSAREIVKDEKRFAEITVRDTGIGIPQDRLGDIFKSFEQVDGSISRLYGGTGLGLPITRSLVQLHGGDIRVESQPGKGSLFIFTLPFASGSYVGQSSTVGEDHEKHNLYSWSKTGDRGKSNASHENVDLHGPQKKIILAVDDDPVNLNVLVNHLSLAGYDIVTAESGSKALEYLNEKKELDLVILDIMMPKISGYDVLKEIRKIYTLYDLPVIMLSARNQVNDIVTGLSYGASDYLSKPFDKNELIARVSTLVTLKHAVKESKQLLQIQEEMALAKKIQQSLFPVEDPSFNDVVIASRCEPVESVGGDFYDFVVHDDDRLGVIIVDVAGHGVPGALIASMAKVVTSIFYETVSEPSEFLAKMNSVLFDKMESLFLTASYMIIDVAEMKLHYARAGHEPLVVLNKKEKVIERYKPAGRACGWIRDIEISTKTIDISKGDRLVLFSDGIIEFYKPGGEMFGAKGFDEFLLDNIELSPQELVNALFNQLEEWNASKAGRHRDDDITLIVIDI